MTFDRRFRRRAANGLFVALCGLATLLALAALGLIMWSLLKQGFGGLKLDIFTRDTPAPGSLGGLRNAIVGSALMCITAMVLAVIVGLLAGTWLAEYGGDTPYGHVVRFLNDVLLSAPSILVGLFVYELIVRPFHGFSGFAGGVALALIAAPVVTRTTEDILRLQPNALREAGVALGAARWVTIRKIIWRGAGGGLLTGGLLAFARISGETAPLLFTALNNQFFALDMTKPVASLPAVIFQYALSAYDDWRALAWAGALLIALTVLSINIIGRVIVAREHAPMTTHAALDGLKPFIAEPTEGIALRAKGLDFFYGKTQALFGVDLPIARNKVTALIGPSGCGKSTLLRTFNRMYDLYPGQKAVGTIDHEGENLLAVKDIAKLRSRIGMVFQKPTPFPMSIYDNVAFGVRLYESKSRKAMDEVVEKALRRAALWDEVKDKLHASGLSLSGGQQQRLCVARGIAVEPEILLLDEPASALDPISTAKLEQTIGELKSDFTIVIVTHNLGQAARISDNTGFMFMGRMVEFTPTADMFMKPQVQQTQDYISGRFG